MSELLINDPIPSLVLELYELDAALTSAKIAVGEARTVQREVEDAIAAKKEAILAHMQETGEWQIETEHAKVSMRKTPRQLVIDDEAAIPGDFWKLADPALDRNLLKKALEAATVLKQQIPGAHLEDGGLGLAVSWKEGKA